MRGRWWEEARPRVGAAIGVLMLLIIGASALLPLATAAPAAYALARYTFKLRPVLFLFFLAGIMIPIRLGILPLYLLMRDLGLLDTPVPDGRHPAAGLALYSLYGPRRRPEADVLASLDAVVVDVQEVGVRCYTYATSLALLLEEAAVTGTRVVVCDRPNLLGPRVDGPLLDPALRSFLGYLDLPFQHGLTLGELAAWYEAERLGGAAALVVAPLEGWRRGDPVSGPWLPFQLLGAPWCEGYALARALNALELPGLRFRPLDFGPVSDSHRGEVCHGVQLLISDAAALRPLEALTRVLAQVRALHPAFAWLEAAQMPWAGSPDAGQAWFEPAEGHVVDALTGSDEVRAVIDGHLPWDEVEARWAQVARDHLRTVEPYLRYRPSPAQPNDRRRYAT